MVAAARPGVPDRVPPVLESDPGTTFALGGELGERAATTIDQWVLPAVKANPDMIEMFRRRERVPHQLVAPWAGEYAGKYLTHAVAIDALTGDPRLHAHLDWFVAELISVQAPDGYFGPFPEERRLWSGGGPVIELEPPEWVWETPWDSWGQYHVMTGLLDWHRLTGSSDALAAVRRCADFFATRFLDRGERLSTLGAIEMNQAPAHAFARLYGITGEERYRRLTEWVVDDFATPGAGDYLRAGLAGTPFHATPKPRWESLHPIQALAEMALATGDERYREAFVSLWWSITERDRHITGGFGSDERASGDPYASGPLETCCTVAWLAMSVDMLRLTGESVVADEIELATLNGGLGSLSRSGRWVTYDTPEDGERRAFYVDNDWQARVGAPELSCCAVNGPRVLGLVSAWAAMRGGAAATASPATTETVTLNWYGPGRVSVPLAGGGRLEIEQETTYPLDGNVRLRVTPDRDRELALALRVPGWSEATSMRIDGDAPQSLTPGTYQRIERHWPGAGLIIELEFDLRLRAWTRPSPGPAGQTASEDGVTPVAREQETPLAALFRGPLLLAYDPRHDRHDRTDSIHLRTGSLHARRRESDGWLPPWLLLDVTDADGESVPLVDFASAGEGGDRYRSWLPLEGAAPVAVTRTRPIPTSVVE